MPANKTKDSHSSLSQRSFNTHRKWCFRPSSPTPIFNNSCLIQNALLIQQFRIKLNYKFTYEIRNLFINAYRCASIYGTHAATNGDMYIVGRSIYFRSMHPIGVNLVCKFTMPEMNSARNTWAFAKAVKASRNNFILNLRIMVKDPRLHKNCMLGCSG